MISVVSYPERGQGGRNSYRGNCSPKLIEDLIQEFHIESLSDYMVGGGTTEDVCKAKNVPGTFLDLNRGFDLVEFDIPDRPANIFWHPPYWDMITYSDQQYSAKKVQDEYGFDPKKNDLSRCTSWPAFVEAMNYCLMKQFAAMERGGHLFMLMGDMKRKGRCYSMLCDVIKPGTLVNIVIKMQHNCMSDRQTYSGRFISIVHEYLMILKKENALIFPVVKPQAYEEDIRDIENVGTWRDVVAAIMSEKGPVKLAEIYAMVDGHKKTQTNPHWRDKIRQVLQLYPCFTSDSRGVWRLAS